METESGRTTAVLTEQLENQPKDFAFFQALRLLRLAQQKENGGQERLFDVFRRDIRVRPELSLAFPPVDIKNIEHFPGLQDEEDEEGASDLSAHPLWRFTVTFLGLYGASSPLPTYYTEDLLFDRNQGISVNRDLVDVVNQPFYEMLWLCWRYYRLPMRIVEEDDDDCSRMLWAFGGRDPELLKNDANRAHYTLRRLALYAQHPRSAQSLVSLLRDALQIDSIRVRPFATRRKSLPPDQRCRMGFANSAMGEDCVIGSIIEDCKSCFDLDIGPVNMDTYRTLLPGGSLHKKLRWHLDDFLDQPFDYMLNLYLEDDPNRSARLHAGHWGSLGEEMWLLPPRGQLTERSDAASDAIPEEDTAAEQTPGVSGETQNSPLVSFFISHKHVPALRSPLQAASGQ